LIFFLAELNHEVCADAFLKSSAEKQTQPKDFAMSAVKESRVSCLAVAQAGFAEVLARVT